MTEMKAQVLQNTELLQRVLQGGLRAAGVPSVPSTPESIPGLPCAEMQDLLGLNQLVKNKEEPNKRVRNLVCFYQKLSLLYMN